MILTSSRTVLLSKKVDQLIAMLSISEYQYYQLANKDVIQSVDKKVIHQSIAIGHLIAMSTIGR